MSETSLYLIHLALALNGPVFAHPANKVGNQEDRFVAYFQVRTIFHYQDARRDTTNYINFNEKKLARLHGASCAYVFA